MSETAHCAKRDLPEAHFRDADSDLEPQIRDLMCMATIARSLIVDVHVERPGDDYVVKISEMELEQLVFAVSQVAKMAEDLDKAYLARAQA